ncbi:hypothetical protein CCACVL1_24409 [Corchorus capsularis]|uniref:Leucine-rich repeat-containing N-terminal plant-type domain-containing protein n=1 Tax=Corchorus capsularis TaxID=210143 RepID=A0A1R3GPQ0_COCAP|nr:hypothetical protein CCACVL1_24409 [Corchorus capsularis]
MEITAIYRCLLLLLLCSNCRGCRDEEWNALQQIKSSINNPIGTAFSNWYGKDCCRWEGVECNVSTNRVSTIYIIQKRDPSLEESWYPNASLFAQFDYLKELKLSGNNIGGFTSPHELYRLKHLEELDLHDNSITNASSHLCWRDLPSLVSLDLSKNKLQGNIPNCLCDNSCTELDLSDNELHGSIPACLGNMTWLKHLDLSHNQFNGYFPSVLIHNLTSIESLILSRNKLKGRVPLSIFANLSRLKKLDISHNSHLEIQPESESPSWFPSFSLNGLKLGGCNLKSIPSFISQQQDLRFLDLSNNSLSGPFPKILYNMSSQLTALDISENFLHEELPDDVGRIFLQLHYLNVSFNSFNGKVPPSMGRMNQLVILDMSNNEFVGEIPSNGSCSLEYLRLSGNKLRGDVLPRNSSLPNLKWLYLENNDLSGTFPGSLSKSSDLQMVNMQHNGLSGELSSGLPALPRLKALLLGGNRFEGFIPPQLCQMRDLHILDLSRNNLSGGIPTCIDNITSLTQLQGSYHVNMEYDSRIVFDFAIKGAVYTYKGPVASFLCGIDVSSNRLTGMMTFAIRPVPYENIQEFSSAFIHSVKPPQLQIQLSSN